MKADLPLTPFSYGSALARGVTRSDLRVAMSAGEVYRLSRGIYAPLPTLATDVPSWELHRTMHLHSLRAALQRFPGAVASHTSAAVVHGLELLISASSPVEVTVVERAPKSRRHEGLIIHHTDSTETPFEVVGGIRVTSVARTLADVLRTRRPPHAVAAVDRAVAGGLTSVDDIRAELDSQRRWKGRPRALAALEVVDPVRESWLESFSFVTLHGHGVPVPLPQIELFDEHFRFAGRVDGLWPGSRTFAEADGEGKYFIKGGVEVSAEQTALDKLTAEHARHRRLESLGLAGVRWTGEEMLASPEMVVGRVRAARRRGEGMTFRGWVRWGGRFARLESLPQE